jgi:hypothetical protein
MAIAPLMDQTAKDALHNAIARLPEWLRHDLAAKDSAVRLRAEESLAAILIAALDAEAKGGA